MHDASLCTRRRAAYRFDAHLSMAAVFVEAARAAVELALALAFVPTPRAQRESAKDGEK
jgi:hypothetical protein